jgi:hypothetical protein
MQEAEKKLRQFVANFQATLRCRANRMHRAHLRHARQAGANGRADTKS